MVNEPSVFDSWYECFAASFSLQNQSELQCMMTLYNMSNALWEDTCGQRRPRSVSAFVLSDQLLRYPFTESGSVESIDVQWILRWDCADTQAKLGHHCAYSASAQCWNKVDSTSSLNKRWLDVVSTLCTPLGIQRARKVETTSHQRRCNGRCINVAVTLYKRHVPAGYALKTHFHMVCCIVLWF